MPLSLTYPTWAGLGIVGATLGASLFFGETISTPHWLGIGVILLGLYIMYVPALSGGSQA